MKKLTQVAFAIMALCAMIGCQGGENFTLVERMPYTVPATRTYPAMVAEYYSGPVNADSIPNGPDGYILYKEDQSCYMGEFRDGYPVPQLENDSILLAKEKEGYQRTASGLLYRVLTEGSGTSPKATDKVSFYYEGSLADGHVFDGNYGKEPLEAVAGNMVKGFTEALTMMKPGAEWEIVIPFHLGYGVRGSAGSIPQYATLFFKLKLN